MTDNDDAFPGNIKIQVFLKYGDAVTLHRLPILFLASWCVRLMQAEDS